MRVPGHDNVHLTYCLNVHPGSTFLEAQEAIYVHAREVFNRLARATDIGGPFGPGIWLSAEAASEVIDEKRMAAFARGLDAEGFYAFTFNGFPYGPFHGTRVKEQVYKPDWADDRRCQYTDLLVYILARLLPDGVNGSISTLPVAFKRWADDERVQAATDNLAAFAGFLHDVASTSGKHITLALEPEPGCFLETADDVVRFFADRLVPRGCDLLRREHGLGAAEAEGVLRRHVGVCLDTVHTGVMGEDPAEAVRRLAANGIRVAKVQLGAALSVQVGPDGPPPALDAFRDEVYLHQVSARTADGDVFFTDLPDALEHWDTAVGEWRVHFHVPLSWEGDGPIRTTSAQVTERFLAEAVAAGTEHFELEIYTLDVFPGDIGSVEAVMVRDLLWLLHRFGALRTPKQV